MGVEDATQTAGEPVHGDPVQYSSYSSDPGVPFREYLVPSLKDRIQSNLESCSVMIPACMAHDTRFWQYVGDLERGAGNGVSQEQLLQRIRTHTADYNVSRVVSIVLLHLENVGFSCAREILDNIELYGGTGEEVHTRDMRRNPNRTTPRLEPKSVVGLNASCVYLGQAQLAEVWQFLSPGHMRQLVGATEWDASPKDAHDIQMRIAAMKGDVQDTHHWRMANMAAFVSGQSGTIPPWSQ